MLLLGNLNLIKMPLREQSVGKTSRMTPQVAQATGATDRVTKFSGYKIYRQKNRVGRPGHVLSQGTISQWSSIKNYRAQAFYRFIKYLLLI